MLLSPGMGDLRRTFRNLIPGLVEAEYETITAELRGHGDSDASFAEYGDEATAEDLIALVEEIGTPAVLIDSSMSAAAAVIVAARRPELVRALVLTGHRPGDFEAHRTAVRASLRRPEYASAFSQTTRTSHREAEDLRIAVSVVAKRELLGVLTDTVTGRSGDDAVHRLSVAYREWALRNPGAYPYTLTAANPSSEADVEVSDQLVRVIAAALRGYALDADAEVHVIRRLRAILHGFVALELGGGFALPQDVDESFNQAVESFLTSLPT